MKTIARFSRRSLFLALFGAMALASVVRWPRAERLVVAILRRRVGYLKVDRAAFEAFAGEYVARKKEFEKQLAWLSMVSPIFAWWSPYSWLPMGNPIRRLEDNVVSNFLHSTNFFTDGADESKSVRYNGLSMVGDGTCANPFAQTYYTALNNPKPTTTIRRDVAPKR